METNVCKCNFDTVCERDIDVLLLNSFAVDPGFIKLFARKIKEPRLNEARVISVELSKIDPRWGESDVTVIVEKEGEKYGLLIEDKVSASEQLDQCHRYDERGNIGISNGEYKAYFVFICAPKDYLEKNAEASKYKYQISFEELQAYFFEKDDAFSAVRYEHIRQALVSSKIPYKKIEDDKATMFWECYVNYAREEYSMLQLPDRTKKKSKNGDWPTYHTLLNYKKVYIHHKMNRGIIDLTFSGMANRQVELADFLNEKYGDYEKLGLGIAKVGNSAALRMNLGEADALDFQKTFEEQKEKVIINLDGVKILHEIAGKLNRNEVIELLEKNNE